MTCTSSDGGTTQSASGASSPVTIGSLTNGKTYTCTLTATNALGNSALVASVPVAPNDRSAVHTATGPRSPLTVTGLTVGVHYVCRVAATNAIGTSADSNPFSFTD